MKSGADVQRALSVARCFFGHDAAAWGMDKGLSRAETLEEQAGLFQPATIVALAVRGEPRLVAWLGMPGRAQWVPGCGPFHISIT